MDHSLDLLVIQPEDDQTFVYGYLYFNGIGGVVST